MRRTIQSTLAAAVIGLAGGTAAIAVETPVVTGCPAAYTLRSVDSLEAQDPNYLLPREIDDADVTPQQFFDPNAGNANGYVCARPLPDGYVVGFEASNPGHIVPVDPLYDFIDDDNPAQQP